MKRLAILIPCFNEEKGLPKVLDKIPYDLLKDMQLIGDVLFKSNTEAPKVVLYDYPGSSNGGGVTFFDPTGQGNNAAIGA